MQDTAISRVRYVQENRKMRFLEAYEGWNEGRLSQAEAALLLGQCERSFRRHIERYEADGMDGLLDRRLSQISKRRASSAEVDHVVRLYKSGFAGWNLAHFHSKYKAEFKGQRSYSWLKTVLQGAGVVKASKRRGKHRIKRERAPLAGMMAAPGRQYPPLGVRRSVGPGGHDGRRHRGAHQHVLLPPGRH